MINTIANSLFRWRWLLALLSLFLVALMVSGVRFIQFATDHEVWFSEDNPQLTAFHELQRTFEKSDNVVFIVTPKDGDVFTRDTLSSIEWLTAQAWKIPYSVRVESLSNFQHTQAQGDNLAVGDLVTDAGALTSADLGTIRDIALSEPLVVNRSVSRDGKVAAVNVTIHIPQNRPDGNGAVAGYARKLIAELDEMNPGLDLRLTGLTIMDSTFVEMSQKDMGSLTPIMFAIIFVGLLVLLRSITGMLSILVLIVPSIMATMGTAGWLGVKLTPVSANAPTIVMTVTVAISVHLFVALIQNMRGGLSKRDALVEAMQSNLQPISLATLTTIIGFLSLNVSDVPPFHHLGNMVAAGVTASFVLSFCFLPALVSILPMRKRKAKSANPPLQGLSEFVIANRKALLIGLSCISLGTVAFIGKNEINDEVHKYFDSSIPFRADTDYAAEHLTGPYYFEFSLKTGEPGGINKPEVLQMIDQFSGWLSAQPETVHVNSVTHIMKRLNKNLHGDDASEYRLPTIYDQAAQYLLLYEMSLPYGQDLNNQINVDKSATRIIVSLRNLSSVEMIDYHQRAIEWLSANAPDLEVTAGSPMYMFSHIGQRSVKNMMIGLAIALTLISALIMIALRSTKIGLLSLIPNLLPPAMALGAWGLFSGRLGFSLAVAISMVIGIVVDDTVHFLSKYLRARRDKGLSPEDSVRYAFARVGTALMLTTVVLVAGFMVLTLSTFQVNSDLGLITSITIVVALLLDFLLLPSIILTFDRDEERAPVNASSAAESASY